MSNVLSSSALFAMVDDGAGGHLQTLKRQLKFKLRCLWHGRHIRLLQREFHELGLMALPERDPNLLLRPLRSYLWSSLCGAQRAEALRQHQRWMVDRYGREAVHNLYMGTPVVVADSSLRQGRLTLQLLPAHGLGREGELALQLLFEGKKVMHAAFSVLPKALVQPGDPGRVLVVGNLQGMRQGVEIIRECTNAAERTRPQTIMLTALQGLAQGWNLDGLCGVSTRQHAFAGYRSLSRRLLSDYDALWQEMGATELQGTSHWSLPLELRLRPDHEAPSRKRAELRRRNELRRDIHAQCAAAVFALTPEAGVQGGR